MLTTNFKLIVLGFECSRTTKLHKACLDLVEKWNNESCVELVNDTATMKKFGVSNTPALVVNNNLLFEGCSMSADGIEKMLHKLAT
jgi:protein-disulfide isomerase